MVEVRNNEKYPTLHKKKPETFQLKFAERNQAVSLGKSIEEGRCLCEYQSSQKVTKKGARSNQLRGVGKEGGGVSIQ